jgi:CDGSH-type Zn-finger protein
MTDATDATHVTRATDAPRTTVAPPPAIMATANGPLLVTGAVPLYRRRAVHSEHGEPLAWETTQQVETRERYALCRCGQSANKPFCDGTHARVGFAAHDRSTGTYDERADVLGGTGITVRDDRSICVHAGFCGTRIANVWGQVPETGESTVRAQVIAMVEKCPSGALTYRFNGADRVLGSDRVNDAGGEDREDPGREDQDRGDVEPLYATAIAVTDDGPLWVTGGVSVTLADGSSLETRNRVTLCRCGASANKPLCDGSHKTARFEDAAR